MPNDDRELQQLQLQQQEQPPPAAEEVVLNSSDWEFDEDNQPQNRFQHAGQASLAKLLDRKFEDRYETKRSVKQRQPFNINPRLHYSTTLWLNRIQTFREHTLCVDMSKPPVGQEFERFAEALAPKVRPKGGHAVPSYQWLQMGLATAADGLLNLYDYRLSPHDTKRLTAMMHLMLKQGKLTKDPVREKQWAGLSILRTMVHAWLIKALTEGTTCWDQVLSRVGTMVWMSALQCRAGDFLKATVDDHPLPYLAYRDIELRLVGGWSLEHLTAKVTLRNVKGDKRDPSRNLIRLLHCCEEPSENTICPVKILLILALRTGHVAAATTAEQLLDGARNDGLGAVRWVDADDPVFCAFDWVRAIRRDEPANTSQVGYTIIRMCQEAGILARLVSHDFRRGGAKDIQNLSVNPKGFLTSDAVADSLGHSIKAQQAGITQQYAGHRQVDFFQLRRQQPEEETSDPFGPGFAPEPMKKRRLASRELSRRIEAEELGAVNDKSLRHRISNRIHQEDYQSQLDENSRRPALTPWTASVMNVKVPQKRRPTERSVSPAAPVNMFSHPETDLEGGGLGDDEYAHRDGDDESMVIDPRLLDDTNDIASALSGDLDLENMREATSAALVHIVGSTVASTTGSHPRDSAALLLLESPQEFVSVFSKINLVCRETHGSDARKKFALSLRDGGSRDKATLFKWKCKNASTGCTYESSSARNLRIHQGTCTGTARPPPKSQ